MDKKSKTIFVLLALAILVSLGVTYYKTIVSGEFKVIDTEVE